MKQGRIDSKIAIKVAIGIMTGILLLTTSLILSHFDMITERKKAAEGERVLKRLRVSQLMYRAQKGHYPASLSFLDEMQQETDRLLISSESNKNIQINDPALLMPKGFIPLADENIRNSKYRLAEISRAKDKDRYTLFITESGQIHCEGDSSNICRKLGYDDGQRL